MNPYPENAKATRDVLRSPDEDMQLMVMGRRGRMSGWSFDEDAILEAASGQRSVSPFSPRPPSRRELGPCSRRLRARGIG